MSERQSLPVSPSFSLSTVAVGLRLLLQRQLVVDMSTTPAKRRWKRVLFESESVVADRKLACCIPIQCGENRPPRVLLVSSRSTPPTGDGDLKKSLVFPKGGWEEYETLDQAAAREAFEEAGVAGRLETPHFAVFEYDSEKKDQGICRNRIVFVYVLHVEVEHDDWPEKDARKRYWMELGDAGHGLKHDWMRAALDVLLTETNGWT